jgi:dimethylamine/trimethylamine dehydrogenase
VRDYREHALVRRANVSIYRESPLEVTDILEFDFPHVIIATGAHWRSDGLGRGQRKPITGLDRIAVLTPDDIMRGNLPGAGPVVIYDTDQAYMAGVIAEHLSGRCPDITLATPAAVVSPWTAHTLEQGRVQASLMRLGVSLEMSRIVIGAGEGRVEMGCVYTGQTRAIPCATLILVTERLPEAHLAEGLQASIAARPDGVLRSVQTIGDALAPGLIADAVFSGHLAARDFQRDPREVERDLFVRDMPSLTITGAIDG